MRCTPAGVGRCTGPATRMTSAPRRAAAAAIAKPILPLLRLPMKRTGSMSSKVGPGADHDAQRRPASAVNARLPTQRGDDLAGSSMRPGPDSPQACGAVVRAERPARRARAASRRWPGSPDAPTSGGSSPARSRSARSVARHSVLTRSSARPCASLAMMLAVAGAITTGRPSAPVRYAPSPLRRPRPTASVRTGAPGQRLEGRRADEVHARSRSSPPAPRRRRRAGGAPARRPCTRRCRRRRTAGSVGPARRRVAVGHRVGISLRRMRASSLPEAPADARCRTRRAARARCGHAHPRLARRRTSPRETAAPRRRRAVGCRTAGDVPRLGPARPAMRWPPRATC